MYKLGQMSLKEMQERNDTPTTQGKLSINNDQQDILNEVNLLQTKDLILDKVITYTEMLRLFL